MNKEIMESIRPDRIHRLKTWPKFFWATKAGFKKFEVRKNDRDFEVGDVLILEEWNPDTKVYTGEIFKVRVIYILDGGTFGIQKGHVVMAIEKEEFIIPKIIQK